MENATKPKTNREWLMVIYNEVKGHKARIWRLELLMVSVILGLLGITLKIVLGG